MLYCMSWTVYEHITQSGKRYIGITSKKPENRWHNGRGYKKGTAFRGAIDKYGWNDIQHNILFDDLTEKEAKWLENYLICYYWTFVGFKDCKGYNMTLGGEGSLGYVPTEESRIKNSESNKGKTSWIKGKHQTEETKNKIGISNKGKPAWNKGKHMTEESRRKNSEAHKGKTTWKGKHHTEESRKNMSESHKGKTPWNKGIHRTEEEKMNISLSLKCKNKGKPCPNKGKHWKLIDGKRVYYE